MRFLRWLAAAALCLAVPPATDAAAALSLHAAQLSPALSLLTWSGVTPESLLSLSLNSLIGSRRPLSLSAASSAHLLVTAEPHAQSAGPRTFALCASQPRSSRDKGTREDNPTSADPMCAHATLPAVSAASAPSLTEGARQPQWDLSGARLHAEVRRSPADPSSHRVRWSAPAVSSDPGAPPLLYSLFAAWNAPTVSASELSADGTNTQATLEPTLQSHSIRICSVHTHTNHPRTRLSSDPGSTLHCDIDQHRLPAGMDITLQLITECDYQTIEAEGAPRMPRCLSAVSPPITVTLKPSLIADPLPVVAPLVSFTAAVGVAQVVNDTAVRTALCVFFNQTSGPQWDTNTGWCDPAEPICADATHTGWVGVGCDPSGQFVTSLLLSDAGLASDPQSGVDISPLFTVVNQLVTLDLSENGLRLFRLDLSPLANLTSLALPSRNVQGTGTQPLILPHPTCQLDIIDLKFTTFAVAVDGWSACTQLTAIDISQVQTPFPLALITRMPLLQLLTAAGAALSGDAVGSYGGGLSGGELTQFILAHLNETNPQLQSLDLANCVHLPFGLPNATDNWPHIVAPSLTTLTLDGLTLRTGLQGPADPLWLADIPSLTQLSMRRLAGATIHTAAFVYASRSLQSLQCDCPLLGDLSPLLPLSSLNSLGLSGSGLRSSLPSNISATWPGLRDLQCSNCNLFGALPDFRYLPDLQTMSLGRNSLTGAIGVDFARDSPQLAFVMLAANQLRGPLPSFCGNPLVWSAAFDTNLIEWLPDLSCYGNLESLSLQANPMRGQLPTDLWQRLTAIEELSISQTLLNGSIPDGIQWGQMSSLFAADCAFSGRLPRNIDADVMDLSNNNFTGPLILFDERFSGTPSMTSLKLTSAGRLACPIQLDALTRLDSLDISGNGLGGCAFANITLPTSLTQLDISNNAWLPFDLRIPPSVSSLQASEANVRGILTDSSGLPNLLQITLDGNPLDPSGNSKGVSVFDQLTYLLDGTVAAASRLRVLSCQRCGLALSFNDLMTHLTENYYQNLQIIRLDDNALWGDFSDAVDLPLSMTAFSVSGNSRIRGRLLLLSDQFPGLASLDFGGTRLAGPIPSSWTNLPALTQLNITKSNIQCELCITAESTLQCADQSLLTASPTITIESTSLSDSTAGVHCSALTLVATGSTSVTADPSYHWWTECRCDANSFGLNALCSRCPEGCTCAQDRIQNCFPVVRRGSIAVRPEAVSTVSRTVVAGSIVAFSVAALLPCPRTVTGDSLCNPDGLAWPSFYRIVEQAADASLSASLADSDPSSSASEFDLSGWCAAGHSGRLCAACAPSYFSSGRWCLKCLSEGVHVMILCANLMLIVALIAYLFVKSPGAATSVKGLQLYRSRLARSAGLAAVSEPMRELNRDAAPAPLPVLPASPAFSSSDAAPAGPPADPANPLKLLIFHCQQLSLLLHTSTSLPPVMAGLLGALNSGSTGFSLSSLVAMECLTSWTLAARCWMCVVVPALIGLVAAATAILSPRSGPVSNRSVPLVPRSPTKPMELQGRDEPLLRAEAEQSHEDAALVALDQHAAASSTDGPAHSCVVPRIYSVCVSLLYFLVFPCAQTVLSAVACTDTRESGRSYLNLYPDQSCDAEWRRTVLPPALLGLLFWVVAFPLGSTLMLMRLRARLADSEAMASGSAASASALSVWPICSDLLLAYSPRFWYWDQLLLMRRLMLVAAVTIIPASSLYLPLCLFAIIQLSALQQHAARPYEQAALNAGELASLYLLLINYISAIILQTGLTDGGFHQTANGWAAALFVANAAFLLILVAGLFGWARQCVSTRWAARMGQRS